ncbi:hypothetical protein N7532_003301 [Penicillium argentinense]|uniref:Uncharacterized protein n=1 Tax=Penicillium argentinense TaxID=1131581 RepID=A0A9W9FMN0_9EURO|nr:uncharacterized protein N7532_003301 [Penicillium argentinense]KAJ5102772.1 hypothetical protein N7532_003301 [Penicillium argentinense]
MDETESLAPWLSPSRNEQPKPTNSPSRVPRPEISPELPSVPPPSYTPAGQLPPTYTDLEMIPLPPATGLSNFTILDSDPVDEVMTQLHNHVAASGYRIYNPEAVAEAISQDRARRKKPASRWFAIGACIFVPVVFYLGANGYI